LLVEISPAVRRVNRHTAVSAAFLAGLLLFETACRPKEADKAAEATAVEVAAAFEQPLPALGTARVAFANGRVSVNSNGAERLAILEQLAQKAGFALLRGNLKRQTLTLRIEDAPLVEALATVLVGVRYSLGFDFDAAEGGHVVREVAVGPQVTVAVAAVAAAPPAEIDSKGREIFKKPRGRSREMSPEESQRMHEWGTAQAEAIEPQLLVQLEDPDPRVRAEAVSLLPVFGEGAEDEERFQRVTTLLADDPDRGVRIAAAERLGESESTEAVEPLVLALSDSDRGVVLAAIEALEDVDDTSAIPHLESLLEDFDEEIRDAAESAIQFIE
jgi:hypothetical protein